MQNLFFSKWILLRNEKKIPFYACILFSSFQFDTKIHKNMRETTHSKITMKVDS